MEDIKEYQVSIEFTCGAATPEEAVDQFRDWLAEGSRTIVVHDLARHIDHEINL
jgi:hypothetical protein